MIPTPRLLALFPVAVIRFLTDRCQTGFHSPKRSCRPRFAPKLWQRAVSLALMALMVGNPALAMPGMALSVSQLVAETVAGTQQDVRFWWHSSGWEAFALAHWPFRQSASAPPKGWDGKGAPARPRPAPETPEKKEDREQKVARVRISPGDVTIRTGEQVVFAAVAYDKDGAPISGLDCSWDGWDEDKNLSLIVSPKATFASGVPGHYKLTATIAGRQAHVKVTVVGEERRPNVTSETQTPVSSRDVPPTGQKQTSSLAPISGRAARGSVTLTPRSAKQAGARREALRAAASNLALRPAVQISGEDTTGWNTINYTTADDPGKERGEMPGHAADGGAGSGNFQFAAPLLGLDGRGIDLNLALSYNSRLWHKSGSNMYFDIDRDWIPGWALGFGKIVMSGNSYMLIGGDGTRRSYAGIYRGSFSSIYSSLQTFEAYTTDGSFIDYYAEGYKPQFDNSGGKNMIKAWARLPNGTQIEYGAPAKYAMYPTQITDANGNYLTITYRNNEGPNIDTITDTLGRVIRFYYETQADGTELLTAITTPGLADAQGSSTPRVVARLQYNWITLSNAGANYGFVSGPSGLTTKVRQSTIPVLKAIYYPATGTGYWFGDADSYSPYGMIRKVSERRGMTFSGPPPNDLGSTGQGTITAGLMSREMTYTHPSSPGYSYPHISGSLTDTPTFTQMTEDWLARDTAAPPVTQFAVVDNVSTLIRTTTITRPDGVRIEQDTDNNPSSPTYGLLLEDRAYPDGTSQTLLHKSKVFWEHGAYSSPRPTRTEVTDDRQQLTATNYAYGTFYNQVIDRREYGYGGSALLQRIHTEYDNSVGYTGYLINSGTLWWHAPGVLYGGPQWSGPHLFNLVTSVEVYASDDTTRVARTEYQYDQVPAWQLPDTPGVTQRTAAPDFRGNVTSVKRYANAVTLDRRT
jgi:hypothetical protein